MLFQQQTESGVKCSLWLLIVKQRASLFVTARTNGIFISDICIKVWDNIILLWTIDSYLFSSSFQVKYCLSFLVILVGVKQCRIKSYISIYHLIFISYQRTAISFAAGIPLCVFLEQRKGISDFKDGCCWIHSAVKQQNTVVFVILLWSNLS